MPKKHRIESINKGKVADMIENHPSITDAACRCLALRAIVARWLLEYYAKEGKNYDLTLHELELELSGLQDWASQGSIKVQQTSLETGLLNRPLLAWSKEYFIEGFRWIESLGAMMWALSVIDKLPLKKAFDPYHLVYDFEVMNSIEDFQINISIRPVETLKSVQKKMLSALSTSTKLWAAESSNDMGINVNEMTSLDRFDLAIKASGYLKTITWLLGEHDWTDPSFENK